MRIEHQPCHKNELPVDPEERRQTYSVARLDQQYCGPHHSNSWKPCSVELLLSILHGLRHRIAAIVNTKRTNTTDTLKHRHTQKIENIGHPHYSSKKVIFIKKEKEQQNLARFEANSPVFDP